MKIIENKMRWGEGNGCRSTTTEKKKRLVEVFHS